jgi:hypothetical protein
VKSAGRAAVRVYKKYLCTAQLEWSLCSYSHIFLPSFEDVCHSKMNVLSMLKVMWGDQLQSGGTISLFYSTTTRSVTLQQQQHGLPVCNKNKEECTLLASSDTTGDTLQQKSLCHFATSIRLDGVPLQQQKEMPLSHDKNKECHSANNITIKSIII